MPTFRGAGFITKHPTHTETLGKQLTVSSLSGFVDAIPRWMLCSEWLLVYSLGTERGCMQRHYSSLRILGRIAGMCHRRSSFKAKQKALSFKDEARYLSYHTLMDAQSPGLRFASCSFSPLCFSFDLKSSFFYVFVSIPILVSLTPQFLFATYLLRWYCLPAVGFPLSLARLFVYHSPCQV